MMLLEEALWRTHTLKMQRWPSFRNDSNQKNKSTLHIPFSQELQENSLITIIKMNAKYTSQ